MHIFAAIMLANRHVWKRGNLHHGRTQPSERGGGGGGGGGRILLIGDLNICFECYSILNMCDVR